MLTGERVLPGVSMCLMSVFILNGGCACLWGREQIYLPPRMVGSSASLTQVGFQSGAIESMSSSKALAGGLRRLGLR